MNKTMASEPPIIPASEPPTKNTNPLYLPPGSVRSIIALTLTGAVTYLSLIGTVSPEALEKIVLIVVAFYFGTKTG